jgi:hypothetical protein
MNVYGENRQIREGKPEQKFEAALGTINSKCFQRSKQKLHNFFLWQTKNSKTVCARTKSTDLIL